ncbi:MAG: DUF547 domain-containing protein [Gammaproteobacteria bacterium]
MFSPYGEILENHLVEIQTPEGGLVSAFRYRQAHDDEQTMNLIDRQQRRLTRFNPDKLDNKSGAVSFWINAYNFFMLAWILENPLKDGAWVSSVKDYGSWFNPYRIFKQETFDIGGHKYSLDEIEKEILLGETFREKGWKDARVHFAVNCASVGCPPLRSRIYTPDNLDAMLTENTRMALNTPRHIHIEGDTLYLTSLFDWYESDFVEEAGSVHEYLKRYLPEHQREAIEAVTSIRHIEYDWSLNEPANFPELRQAGSIQ